MIRIIQYAEMLYHAMRNGSRKYSKGGGGGGGVNGKTRTNVGKNKV